jgi:hypothetical protein
VENSGWPMRRPGGVLWSRGCDPDPEMSCFHDNERPNRHRQGRSPTGVDLIGHLPRACEPSSRGGGVNEKTQPELTEFDELLHGLGALTRAELAELVASRIPAHDVPSFAVLASGRLGNGSLSDQWDVAPLARVCPLRPPTRPSRMADRVRISVHAHLPHGIPILRASRGCVDS